MRQEWLARSLVILLLAVAVGIPTYGWWQSSQGIVLHARMAETGGWTPENLTAMVGMPLHLRLTSDDVTHSFAIGQSDQPAVDVLPGEMTEVILTFDRPGKYTFYCTRWCSINHWRMRGVIEVTDMQAAASTTPEPVEPPLYVTLGLELDAERQSDVTPDQMPSARRGDALRTQPGLVVQPVYLSRAYYQTHTPLETWKALRAEAAFQNLTDQDVWDLVAWVWQSNTTTQELREADQLYRTNCAACHGETGVGDGVFAEELAQPEEEDHSAMTTGQMTTQPADFTKASRMLAASPALLQGKIVRGGMGTGMPYWGPIFTEEQTWALVAYLWSFQFEMETKP